MSYQLLIGDALEQLRTLPSDSVSCAISSPPYLGLRSYLPADHPDKALELGGEDTPDEYVARLVEVFREVRRVLHPSGTCWINLGDTIQEKQVLGIPWRVAFALQADGWILRQELIWHKLAPMPESVTDRCTKAHEQVFLLAKSERYYFDAEAIAEPATYGRDLGLLRGRAFADGNHVAAHAPSIQKRQLEGIDSRTANESGTRNKRSVWTLGPESYSGSHYAVMPTKLVEPCVLAGTSAHGVCAACGSPWERLVEREVIRQGNTANALNGTPQPAGIRHGLGKSTIRSEVASTTLGWAATCTCGADVTPAVVLDPFAGSGTTLAVALKHGRRAIGIDLDPRNAKLVTQRIEQSQPLLLQEII